MQAPISRRAAYAGAVLFAALASSGCSGPKMEFAGVEGTITMGGKPLAGVVVYFYPDDTGPEQLPFARGTTDGSGNYKLTSSQGAPGVLVGRNRVVVNWPPRERSDDPAARSRPLGPPIPIPYTQASDTPLIVEVKAGGPQTINLTIP